MALGACSDQAQAQDSSVVKVAENAAVAPTSLEKDEGINFSSNAVSIPDQISAVERKIAALEEKGVDNLSDAEFDALMDYQDELVAMINQNQVKQEEAIDKLDNETAQGFAEIKKKIGS